MLLNGFIVSLKVIFSFFALQTLVITFYTTLIFVIPFRLFLSLIFLIFHKNEYKLINTWDAVYAAWNSKGNNANIAVFIIVDGPCDIKRLRERVKEIILKRDKFGYQPYEKLLQVFTEKYKFLCYSTDKRKTIDFNKHIRICPGIDNPHKVYSEHEFFDLAAQHNDSEWPEGIPKWEILVAPKVENETSKKLCSVLLLKFHHFHLDGVSIAQFVKNVIADQPSSRLSVDPVNPPIPHIPLVYKYLIALKSFIMEPYFILKTFWNTTDHFLCEKSSSGNIFGRSKMRISQETIRLIRKSHNCTTQAVFHSAFLGALEKIAKSKGIPIPPNTIAALVSACLPYPDEFPRNRAYFGYQLVKIGLDPIQRLKEVNNFMLGLQQRQYALMSTIFLTKLLVMYPMPIVRFFVKFFKPCYYLSNIPAFENHLKLHGDNIKSFTGNPPLCNGIGFSAATAFYKQELNAGFLFNKSEIISNRVDMEECILEFENQICDLAKMINGK